MMQALHPRRRTPSTGGHDRVSPRQGGARTSTSAERGRGPGGGAGKRSP